MIGTSVYKIKKKKKKKIGQDSEQWNFKISKAYHWHISSRN